jgi:hypothetical protein
MCGLYIKRAVVDPCCEGNRGASLATPCNYICVTIKGMSGLSPGLSCVGEASSQMCPALVTSAVQCIHRRRLPLLSTVLSELFTCSVLVALQLNCTCMPLASCAHVAMSAIALHP